MSSTETQTPLEADSYCPECGYSLRGLFVPGTCPECSRRYFTANRWTPGARISLFESFWHFGSPAFVSMLGCVLLLVNLFFFHNGLLRLTAILLIVFACAFGLVKPWTASAAWLREHVPPGRRRIGVFAALSEHSPFAAVCFLLSWFPHCALACVVIFGIIDLIRHGL